MARKPRPDRRRRRQVPSPAEPQPPKEAIEPPFVPLLPPAGSMHPADDGLVARMYADRQNRYHPTILGQPTASPPPPAEPPGWVGQPQPVPKTLLSEALDAAPEDIANLPPRYAVEQTAPMLVAAPNSNALSEPVPASPPYVEPSRPRDDFAEAAAEAVSNPDPAVEREIFDSAFKEEIGTPLPAIEGSMAVVEGSDTVVAKGTVRPKKARRLRSAAGRSVQANSGAIVLQVASLVLLIDDKLASLRDERPNDPDALASRDEAVAHYEGVKRGLEALRDVAIEVGQGKADDKAVTKATTTFFEGIRNWWNKKHVEICADAYDTALGTYKAALFVSCLSLCSLAGCGGLIPTTVLGVLAGGKPVIDALKALPKRLFKDHGQ
jgi:hypothetical protein